MSAFIFIHRPLTVARESSAAGAPRRRALQRHRTGGFDGGQREQGDSRRQSRPRPGGAQLPERRQGGEPARRHLRELARPPVGRAREKTEWHSVAIYNENIARIAEQYLRKGSKVYLEGQLETRKWQDQYGQDRYTTEVSLRFNAQMALLDGRGEGGAPATTIRTVPAGPAARAAAPPARWTTKSRSDRESGGGAAMGQGIFDLTGRTALVTGSSRGLGRAIAAGFATAGARVVLNGMDPGRLAAAVDEMRGRGPPGARGRVRRLRRGRGRRCLRRGSTPTASPSTSSSTTPASSSGSRWSSWMPPTGGG